MQAPNLHLKGTDKLQGLDYVYTVNGQLKAINHPSLDEAKDPGQDGKSGAPNAGFAKDVFGLTLDYHQSDYIRTSSNVLSSSDGSNPGFYNGRIHAQRWKMRATTNGVNNGADYLDYGGALQFPRKNAIKTYEYPYFTERQIHILFPKKITLPYGEGCRVGWCVRDLRLFS